MVDMLTEDEQLIMLKAWWMKYRGYIIIGLIIGLALFFSWRTWVNHQANARLAAGISYQSVLEQLAAGDSKGAASNADDQIETQHIMPYELMNQLIMGRLTLEQETLDKAVVHLKTAITQADDTYFKELASVRLARVYLLQNKPEEALQVLNTVEDKKYPDWFLVKADAQVALKKFDDARTDYNKALELYPPFGFQRQLVTMQIADLPQ